MTLVNHEWMRFGAALLCGAVLGGLVYFAIGDAAGADLVRALSLCAGVLGLMFLAFGVTDRNRNTPER